MYLACIGTEPEEELRERQVLVDHVRQVERRVVRHRGRHGRRRHRRGEQRLGLGEHPEELKF